MTQAATAAQAVSTSGPPPSGSTSPVSWSVSTVCSRRAWLPKHSHAKSPSGRPSSANARSSSRRCTRSVTVATTRPTSRGPAPSPSIRATEAGSSVIAAATSGTVADRSTAERTASGLRASSVCRSVDVTIPTTRPPSTTGRWCTPAASISSCASAQVTSAPTTSAGYDATSATTVSAGRPSATSRERRSRSVRTPGPSRPSTSTEETRRSRISPAASRQVTDGSTISTGLLITARTGVACSRVPVPWTGGRHAGSRAPDQARDRALSPSHATSALVTGSTRESGPTAAYSPASTTSVTAPPASKTRSSPRITTSAGRTGGSPVAR